MMRKVRIEKFVLKILSRGNQLGRFINLQMVNLWVRFHVIHLLMVDFLYLLKKKPLKLFNMVYQLMLVQLVRGGENNKMINEKIHSIKSKIINNSVFSLVTIEDDDGYIIRREIWHKGAKTSDFDFMKKFFNFDPYDDNYYTD